MRDAQTGSQWLHYTGECVDGPMAGRALSMLTTNVLSWNALRQRLPQATVIANSTSLFRRLLAVVDARREAPSFFRLPSWFTRTMRRGPSPLPDMAFGLGVVVGRRNLFAHQEVAGARFYPYAALRQARLVEDTLASTPLLLLWDADGGHGVAFTARLDGAVLRFHLGPAGEVLDERGNRYDLGGRVVEGPQQGGRLPPLPALATRWYGFGQTYASADVFQAPDGPGGTPEARAP